MGHFPKKFSESPSSETTVPIEKSSGMQKWYGHPVSSCKVWWEIRRCTGREKEKLGLFLFVTLWILNLNKRLAHQRFSHPNSDIVAICRSILMQISAFFRG